MAKSHLYGFEHPQFYVHIKASNFKSAVDQFCIYFGESALNEVDTIHNLRAQSFHSKKVE